MCMVLLIYFLGAIRNLATLCIKPLNICGKIRETVMLLVHFSIFGQNYKRKNELSDEIDQFQMYINNL